MMAASHGQGEQKNAHGVVSGHAYSLISVKEFQHDDKTIRLLVLRNPWGQGEWTGDWSDHSPLWTPELREQVGCFAKDDGTFHIPYGDYLRQYCWTSVSMDVNYEFHRSGRFF